ncbi:MAG: glycosyl transferase family 2 [Frankiales bacterium]|nr:glycosyl transferase family 2 [Frankiales bacterium]
MTTTPRFSVLTPVYDPAVDVLRAMIDSVTDQSCPDWELILVDDCSPNPAVRAELKRAAALDARIRVSFNDVNLGIAGTSQRALELARGQFVALLDHDDALSPNALSVVADALQPDTDYLYSDEDKINPSGDYVDPFRKPIWSPERLRSQMYTGHLSVLRTSLTREVGGFRAGFDGSQDHDLVLRVTEQARGVVHIPEILYHWRVVPGSTAANPTAKSYAWEAGRKAVAEHAVRTGVGVGADFGPLPGTYRVQRMLPPDVSVSIVIPTRGSAGLVWGLHRCFVLDAVRSALSHTNHDNVEIVAVCDTATPRWVIDELRVIAGDKLVVVDYDEPFNFSRKCNAGYLAARGDVLVMLNDDVEITSRQWLENLVAPLLDHGVGLTGAKLFYSDGTIQHGGHLYDRQEYSHAFLGSGADSTEGFSALFLDREVSGVTAACAAIRRDTFEEVGGFCEDLPGNFNDVDFCFKITASGYRIVWMAHVESFHFESRTREPKVHSWEQRRVMNRWGGYDVDPYLPRPNNNNGQIPAARRTRAQRRRHSGIDAPAVLPSPR